MNIKCNSKYLHIAYTNCQTSILYYNMYIFALSGMYYVILCIKQRKIYNLQQNKKLNLF